MSNTNVAVYYGAIVIGILALIIGFLSNANIALGYHPTRAYVEWAVGAVLIIVGIVGIVMARRRA